MSQFMQEKWSMFEGTHGMRTELLDTLSDADLAYTPGGQAMTFGALWKQMGEIEHAYTESIKTRTQDWSYHSPEPGLETSVAQLKAWFQKLDEDMKMTVEALADNEFKQTVKRDSGYEAPIEMQLDFYIQAALIFFGKASIYVRAMNRPLTKSMADWIW